METTKEYKIEYFRNLNNDLLLAKYFALVKFDEWKVEEIELCKTEILRRMVK